ncbi:MAG: hypothetical protein Q4G58_11365 [bacterium]|nr:hypothetical protein [bacterium]
MVQILSSWIRLFLYLLWPLVLTLLVEVNVGLLLLRDVNYLPTLFVMNLLTNPLLNLLLILLVGIMNFSYGITLGVLEIIVWVAEGWILWIQHSISIKKCLLLSFILNGCSYVAGLLI